MNKPTYVKTRVEPGLYGLKKAGPVPPKKGTFPKTSLSRNCPRKATKNISLFFSVSQSILIILFLLEIKIYPKIFLNSIFDPATE